MQLICKFQNGQKTPKPKKYILLGNKCIVLDTAAAEGPGDGHRISRFFLIFSVASLVKYDKIVSNNSLRLERSNEKVYGRTRKNR